MCEKKSRAAEIIGIEADPETDDSANWLRDLRAEKRRNRETLPRRGESVESRCRKPEESDWFTYWGSRQSWWIPKTWSSPGKIFKVAPQEQLVDLESRYTSQYHSASLRARFGELSSDDLRLAACEPVAATRRKIPYCYHSNFLIPTCWECVRLYLAAIRPGLPPPDEGSEREKTENTKFASSEWNEREEDKKNKKCLENLFVETKIWDWQSV